MSDYWVRGHVICLKLHSIDFRVNDDYNYRIRTRTPLVISNDLLITYQATDLCEQ